MIYRLCIACCVPFFVNLVVVCWFCSIHSASVEFDIGGSVVRIFSIYTRCSWLYLIKSLTSGLGTEAIMFLKS
jgi:hypothetical protein